jgi:hypothetical protein
MNAYITSTLMVVSSCTVATAEDVQSTPRPRLRLDPVTRTAVPASEAGEKVQPAVVVMDKVEVKAGAIPMERLNERPYEGEFSAHQGGRVLKSDGGPVRWEIGVWPSIDQMFTDSGLRPRAETRLNVDMVRIRF